MRLQHACALLALCSVSLGASGAADEAPAPGTLVVVNVKEHKEDVAAKVGDLLQFAVRYPIVPNAIVTQLKVELQGDGLSKVAVVRVPQVGRDGRPLVGAGELAVYVRADKEGAATVKITPNNKDAKTYEFKVKVAAVKD